MNCVCAGYIREVTIHSKKYQCDKTEFTHYICRPPKFFHLLEVIRIVYLNSEMLLNFREFSQTHAYKLYFKLIFCTTLRTFLPIILCVGFTIQMLRELHKAKLQRRLMSGRDLRLVNIKVSLSNGYLSETFSALCARIH